MIFDRVMYADLYARVQGKGGLKAATAINVRHILCEKHSKATEALQKIQVCFPFFGWIASLMSSFCRRRDKDSTKSHKSTPRTRRKVWSTVVGTVFADI